MNNKNKIIYFILMLFISVVSAQEYWSLDDCVEYATQHNLEIKDLQYTKDANQETYKQSYRNLLPSIEASSNYNIRYGRSVDPNNNSIVNTDFFSNTYALSASIDLFQGFQKQNSIKASKFLYKAANHEMQHQKYLLAFRVMGAFYDIQFMEGLLLISQQQEEVSQKNYDLVNRQVELGQKAKADLYDAEAALLSDQLLVTQSTNNLIAARLKLMQEMNLQDPTAIAITPLEDKKTIESEMNMVKNRDSIFVLAKEFIPIIKAQELRTKAAKKQVAVARGDLYPSLSLFAGYQTGYFETNINDMGEVIPFRNQIKDNAAQFVGVSLNVPISNGWSNRSRVKQQKVEFLRAKNNLDIQKQELFQLIQQLVQDGEALKTEYQQSSQKMKAQDLTFAVAQKRYEKGLINAIELNQSKNLLANAQNENLQVQLRLKINESTLDFYQGLPIFNINIAQ